MENRLDAPFRSGEAESATALSNKLRIALQSVDAILHRVQQNPLDHRLAADIEAFLNQDTLDPNDGFVTLGACPPGLFVTREGVYGFKSEYKTRSASVAVPAFTGFTNPTPTAWIAENISGAEPAIRLCAKRCWFGHWTSREKRHEQFNPSDR